VSVDPRTTFMTGPVNGPRQWTWAERDARSAPQNTDLDGGTLARFAAIVRHYNGGRAARGRWPLVSGEF
jgi:hypothetical protein